MGFRLAATGPVRAIYTKVVQDHPQLREMVAESGFDNLGIKEQQHLIHMVDMYEWHLSKAKDYGREYQTVCRTYSERAESLKEQIKTRFGHVMKQ